MTNPSLSPDPSKNIHSEQLYQARKDISQHKNENHGIKTRVDAIAHLALLQIPISDNLNQEPIQALANQFHSEFIAKEILVRSEPINEDPDIQSGIPDIQDIPFQDKSIPDRAENNFNEELSEEELEELLTQEKLKKMQFEDVGKEADNIIASDRDLINKLKDAENELDSLRLRVIGDTETISKLQEEVSSLGQELHMQTGRVFQGLDPSKRAEMDTEIRNTVLNRTRIKCRQNPQFALKIQMMQNNNLYKSITNAKDDNERELLEFFKEIRELIRDLKIKHGEKVEPGDEGSKMDEQFIKEIMELLTDFDLTEGARKEERITTTKKNSLGPNRTNRELDSVSTKETPKQRVQTFIIDLLTHDLAAKEAQWKKNMMKSFQESIAKDREIVKEAILEIIKQGNITKAMVEKAETLIELGNKAKIKSPQLLSMLNILVKTYYEALEAAKRERT